MVFKYLLEKEITQIRRNTFVPKLILFFPVMVMCVMPWVMNQEVKNIKVEVVDNDHSVISLKTVHKIEASTNFVFSGQPKSYQQAMGEMERSDVDLVVVIPRGFGRDVVNRSNPQLFVAANAVNGMKGSIGAGYVTQILASGSVGMMKDMTDISTLYLFNKNLNYKLFMIPALLAMVIMLMCGFLPTLNIVGEKEAGTIDQINVTPVSKISFILSKLVPYWVIAAFVITVCLGISWGLYGITCKGNIALVFLLAMLLAGFFSAFGLIISNYSSTLQQSIMVMWFFIVILMLLSGLFTPTRSMPDWAYATTYVNPMHYFIDAIRTVFVRGGTLRDIAHQAAALLAIAVLMGVWAVLSYKKNN